MLHEKVRNKARPRAAQFRLRYLNTHVQQALVFKEHVNIKGHKSSLFCWTPVERGHGERGGRESKMKHQGALHSPVMVAPCTKRHD